VQSPAIAGAGETHPPSPYRWTRIAALALLAGGTLLGLWAFAQVLLRLDTLEVGGDSWAVMRRALDVVDQAGPGQLYATLFFGEGAKFQYAPTSLLPFEQLVRVLPPGDLGFNLLNALLLVLNAVALAMLARQAFGGTGGRPLAARERWLATICAFAAGFIFYPVLRAFALGQIQIWIDFAFTLACLAWLRGQPRAAGFAIGLACLLKPQFALFLLWGVAWRNWRFVGGILLVVVPAGLVSMWRYGIDNHLAYLEVLSFISRHGEVFFANNSINGIAHRLLETGDARHFDSFGFAPYNRAVHAATLLAGLALTALAFLPTLLRRGDSPKALDLCFAALCFTMASPVAWEHHYGIMLPIFVLVAAQLLPEIRLGGRPAVLLLLAAAWFGSAGRWPRLQEITSSPLNLIQAHLFLAAVVLLALVGARVCRRPSGAGAPA
jgi:hypothetical protein